MKNKSFLRAALAVTLFVSVVSSGIARGTHSFTDVPDGQFYTDAVEWAKGNGMTTGSPAGSDTFKPLDNVTRGENITFAKRYDDIVVQPALEDRYTKAEVDAAVADAIEAAAPEVYYAKVNSDGTLRGESSDGITVTMPSTGLYEVEFPPDDVRSCFAHATLSAEPVGLVFIGPGPPDGQISIAEDWDGVFPAFSPDTDSILVATDDSGGVATDQPFHLSIHC